MTNRILFALFFLSFLSYSHCELGATTYCVNIFLDQTFNTNVLSSLILDKCTALLADEGLTNDNGCLTCNARTIINLFDLPPGEQLALSFCIGSTLTCDTKYSGNMETLTNKFANMINTQDKLTEIFGSKGTVVYHSYSIEKDQTFNPKAITAQIVRHTPTSLTYKISSSLSYPVKCYKALAYEKPTFEPGSLYYLLKANTENRVFTESFTASSYDCKTYKMYLQCYTIPFQETAEKVTEIELITIDHKTEGTTCKIIDYDEPIPEEPDTPTPEPEPEMETDNPKVNNTREVNKVKLMEDEEKIDYIDSIKQNLTDDIAFAENNVEKMNNIIRANEVIGAVNCTKNSKSSECLLIKKDVISQTWEVISDEIKGEDIATALGKGKEEYEKNVKIVLQTMHSSLKNEEAFEKDTASTAIEITTKTLQSSLSIIENIENDKSGAIKKDVANLIASTASVMIQVTKITKEPAEKKDTLITKETQFTEIKKTITEVTKCLVKTKVTSIITKSFSYKTLSLTQSTPSRLRRLGNDDLVYEFPEEGIEVVIPSSAVAGIDISKYLIKVINYKSYPFLTDKGMEHFSDNVVSISLINTEDLSEMELKGFKKDSRIQVKFSKEKIDSSFNKCYMYDYEKEDKPSNKDVDVSNEDGKIVCLATKTGDVLVGDYSTGMAWWLILIIVLLCLLFVGGVLLLVFKFVINGKKTPEPERKATLNELSTVGQKRKYMDITDTPAQ